MKILVDNCFYRLFFYFCGAHFIQIWNPIACYLKIELAANKKLYFGGGAGFLNRTFVPVNICTYRDLELFNRLALKL